MKELKFVNKSPNINPEYSHTGDSGFDLRAWIEEGIGYECAVHNNSYNKYSIIINPMDRVLIHTGVYFNIPDNCEIQVRPRSGLALKDGITVLNTPGTVDKNYTNEVCVILFNASNQPFEVCNGDRIAQAVLVPVYNKENVNLVSSISIDENEYRDKNGFGSTGIK